MSDDTLEERFQQCAKAHSRRLLAVARRILRNEEDARDALQDGLLNAFRNLSQFEGRSDLSTWIHRIVVNAALAKYRKRRTISDDVDDAATTNYDKHGILIGPTSEPVIGAAELIENAEMVGAVRDAIDRLPETHRLVLLLRDIEELSTTETAGLLGCKPGAVKTRLHRARLALKSELTPYFDGAGS